MVNFLDLNKKPIVEKVDTEKTIQHFGFKLSRRLATDYSASPMNTLVGNTNTYDLGLETSIDKIKNEIDPTPNHEYTLWIIRKYIDGGIHLWEDMGRVNEYLEIFHRLKKKQKFKAKYSSDINQYKTLSDLGKAIAEFREQAVAKKGKEEALLKKQEAEIIYNDSEIKVVIPYTKEASCFYGRNTQWCTASTQSDNYFQNYSSQGPLYIILIKKENKRYQFHFPSEQFMDENDSRIDLLEFLKKYPKIINVFKEINYYGKDKWQIGNKWYDDNGEYHREDGPAIVEETYVSWYRHGKIHRENGPATLSKEGVREGRLPEGVYWLGWWQNGKLHNENGPASIDPNEIKWMQNGKLFRKDGPALVEKVYDGFRNVWKVLDRYYERSDGGPNIVNENEKILYWIKDGADMKHLHRKDGPAYIRLRKEMFGKFWIGVVESWHYEHEPHREDGPAKITNKGSMFWYIHGEEPEEDGPVYLNEDGVLTYRKDGLTYESGMEEYEVEERQENLKKYGHYNNPKARLAEYKKWTSKEHGFETHEDYKELYKYWINKMKHYLENNG